MKLKARDWHALNRRIWAGEGELLGTGGRDYLPVFRIEVRGILVDVLWNGRVAVTFLPWARDGQDREGCNLRQRPRYIGRTLHRLEDDWLRRHLPPAHQRKLEELCRNYLTSH